MSICWRRLRTRSRLLVFEVRLACKSVLKLNEVLASFWLSTEIVDRVKTQAGMLRSVTKSHKNSIDATCYTFKWFVSLCYYLIVTKWKVWIKIYTQTDAWMTYFIKVQNGILAKISITKRAVCIHCHNCTAALFWHWYLFVQNNHKQEGAIKDNKEKKKNCKSAFSEEDKEGVVNKTWWIR